MLDEELEGITPSGAILGPSKISGGRFDGNTATDGGAIYTAAGYDVIVDSSFTRNFAGS